MPPRGPAQLTMGLEPEAAEKEFSVKVHLARELTESALSRKALQALLEQQKRVEAALRATELRYRTLFEGAPDPVFLLSIEAADSGPPVVERGVLREVESGSFCVNICTFVLLVKQGS